MSAQDVAKKNSNVMATAKQPTTEEFAPFRSFILNAAQVPHSDLEKIVTIARYVSVPKGWFLVREGEKSKLLSFVCRGLFKVSSHTLDGKVFVRDFCPEGTIASDYLAMRSAADATCTIVAMEPSEIIVLDSEQLMPILESTSSALMLTRALLEALTHRLAAREMQLLSLNAQDRLDSFLHSFPELAPRIPKQDIAAYLEHVR